MSNKVKSLVDALFKSNTKVFYDRPDELSAADIAKELELREQTDRMLSQARMKLVNAMFQTNQTTETALDDTPNFDF